MNKNFRKTPSKISEAAGLIQTSKVSHRTWQHSLTKDRCANEEPNIFSMLQHYLIFEFIKWNAMWLLDLHTKKWNPMYAIYRLCWLWLGLHKHTIQCQVTCHFSFQYRLLCKRKQCKHTNSMLSCLCPVTLHTSYRAKYITHRNKTIVTF